MKKPRKRISLAILILISLATSSIKTPAVIAKSAVFPTVELSIRAKQEILMTTMVNHGLLLPSAYKEEQIYAMRFVYNYTAKIISGDVNPNIGIFGFDQSNTLLSDLSKIIVKLQPLISKSTLLSTYIIDENTVIGSIRESERERFQKAIFASMAKRMTPPDPPTISVTNAATILLHDLKDVGFWGYITSAQPLFLPDQWYRLITVRDDAKNEACYIVFKSNYDPSVHPLKADQLNSLYHKFSEN